MKKKIILNQDKRQAIINLARCQMEKVVLYVRLEKSLLNVIHLK